MAFFKKFMEGLKNIGANKAVLALSFGRFGDGMGNSLLFVVIPLYVASLPAPFFDVSESIRAGVLISLFGLVAGFSQPFTGALIDRLDRRKPFIVGGLLLLAGDTIAFAYVQQYHQALAVRAVQGLSLALTIPPTMALLTMNTEKQTRGGAMGIYSTFRVASLAVGPLLGGFIFDIFGFPATFYTAAGFIIVGAVMVLMWVREVPAGPKKKPPFRLLDRSVLANGLPALGFATFMMAGGFAMISPLEQQINARLNQTPTMFGVAFSALMAARILVQVPVGRFSDRQGRKRLVVGGLILMAAGTVPLAYVHSTWQLMFLRVVQGIASGGIAAPVFALAGDLSRAGGEGRQMSIVTMGFALGIALGTLLTGVMAVVYFGMPFILAGVLMGLAAWLVQRSVPETVGKAG